MTAPEPENQPRKKRRPRRHNPAAVGEVFGDFTSWSNTAADYSYLTSLVGLTPLLGLALGPAAIVLGIMARMRCKKNPEVHGVNFANAGIVIGTIDLCFNAAGIACLTRGFGWW